MIYMVPNVFSELYHKMKAVMGPGIIIRIGIESTFHFRPRVCRVFVCFPFKTGS